tara:strand:- start:17431 stop:19422 length:1992 start_codon:yes stop_codon:yes gene_type:complete
MTLERTPSEGDYPKEKQSAAKTVPSVAAQLQTTDNQGPAIDPGEEASSGAGLGRAWWLIATAILAVHSGLLAWSASTHSATWDEGGHLSAGLSHWEFGTFELYSVNPPLVRTVAALPVWLFTDPVLDWSDRSTDPQKRSEVRVGRKLLAVNKVDSIRMLQVARLTCIPFSLLGAVICSLWARDLYGKNAALLALVLWCFSPMILGHGALITPDVAAASTGICALYFFRRYLRQPSWEAAIAAGTACGIAVLTKSTWLVLLPALGLVLWLCWRTGEWLRLNVRHKVHEIASLLLVALVALIVVNAFYGFRGSLTPLRDYRFISDSLAGPEESRDSQKQGNRFTESLLGRIPVPLPRNLVLGIDIQKKDFEKGFTNLGYKSYLLGTWKKGGWWYYYLVSLAVKVPLGTWLIAFLALVVRILLPRESAVNRKEESLLAGTGFVIVALVSSQLGMNRHLRYILPAWPFAFIWISQAARLLNGWALTSRLLLGLGLLWSVFSSLWYFPHSISYFNELTAGPRYGHHVLINSNIDWGQDLLYLKDWLDEHPEVEDLRMAWFGNFDPRAIGIEFRLPSPLFDDTRDRPIREQKWIGPKPGWYAVSVNYLYGHTMPIPDGKGRFKYFGGQPVFEYFREFEPIATAGYSIYIYHLNRDEVNRVRRKLNLPTI